MRELIDMSGPDQAPVVIRQEDQKESEKVGLNIPGWICRFVCRQRMGMLLPLDRI